MGHITTRNFGFHWAEAKDHSRKARERVGQSWLQRLMTTVLARLAADTPPLGTAMAYSHAYRAAPVPKQ